jgi:DNA-binding response OmpR family regulator
MTSFSPLQANGAGRTILVVDDEPGVLNFLQRVLRLASYSVITSRDGNHAWCVIEGGQAKIELVLTDIVMPGSIDGFTLAPKIRRKYSNLPVLFMTGALPPGDEEAAVIERKRLLLRKPFSPKELVEFIDSHFGKAEKVAAEPA